MPGPPGTGHQLDRHEGSRCDAACGWTGANPAPGSARLGDGSRSLPTLQPIACHRLTADHLREKEPEIWDRSLSHHMRGAKSATTTIRSKARRCRSRSPLCSTRTRPGQSRQADRRKGSQGLHGTLTQAQMRDCVTIGASPQRLRYLRAGPCRGPAAAFENMPCCDRLISDACHSKHERGLGSRRLGAMNALGADQNESPGRLAPIARDNLIKSARSGSTTPQDLFPHIQLI